MIDDRCDRDAGLGEVVGDVRNEIGPLGEAHHENIREPMHMNAVQAPHAIGPIVRQLQPVFASHVVSGATREFGTDLES